MIYIMQYNEFLSDAKLLSLIDKTALTYILSGRICKCTCILCSGLVAKYIAGRTTQKELYLIPFLKLVH